MIIIHSNSIIDRLTSPRRNNFYYNKRSFDNMKKMGFNDQEVKDSLWIMNNNENLAVSHLLFSFKNKHTYSNSLSTTQCEWLLSNRRPKLDELHVGLMRGSPLYNSLLKNPIIQLGLLKPKVLFAFLHLLSSNFFNGEPNANRWLNEPEISPIITQVVRLYHSEKPNHQPVVHQSPFIGQQQQQPVGHQSVGHHPARSCFASQTRNSFDSSDNSSDYSTFLIPEILNNLSLTNDNQERQEQPDNWNLTGSGNHATLV